MAEKTLRKDQLFNVDTLTQIAQEFAAGVPGFDAQRFIDEALSGFASRELMARLEWMADCLEAQLASDFPTMADQLEAAMPAPRDPDLTDNDFGEYIHAVPGVLAVRHGLDTHLQRSMQLLKAATQRFSMEFHIRPFINLWKAPVLATLHEWSEDDNYHVRRLVSEGTRPILPWGKSVDLSAADTLPLLDKLYADHTRLVTRSVANHLNDLSKTDTPAVVERLKLWQQQGGQDPKEMAWMTRHALRSSIKRGDQAAMRLLGYKPNISSECALRLASETVVIGQALEFDVRLRTPKAEPVIVDYQLWSCRAKGKMMCKVFKLKVAETEAGKDLRIHKTHKLKADATTFKFYPGPARVVLQVNGKALAEASLTLIDGDQ